MFIMNTLDELRGKSILFPLEGIHKNKFTLNNVAFPYLNFMQIGTICGLLIVFFVSPSCFKGTSLLLCCQ